MQIVSPQHAARSGVNLKGRFDGEVFRAFDLNDPERVFRHAQKNDVHLSRWTSGRLTMKELQTLVQTPNFKSIESAIQGGGLKYRFSERNHVTNLGINYILDGNLSNTLYLILISGTPTTAVTDTMSSHAGWTEVVAYDESVRQTWSKDAASSQSISNSSAALITCSTNSTTFGGMGITSDSTKSGTSGTLVCVVAFTGGNKTLDDGETLSLTYTLTGADT